MFDHTAKSKADFLEMLDNLSKKIKDPESYGFLIDLKNELDSQNRPELLRFINPSKWIITTSDKDFRLQVAKKCAELVINLYDECEKNFGYEMARKVVNGTTFKFE
jgi:hypothetical protein